MALVPAAAIYVTQQGANRCYIVTWGKPTAENTPKYPIQGDQVTTDPPAPTYYLISQGDTCQNVMLPAATDRCIQFQGTWGGATLTIVGSNDGTNFVTLNDSGGTPIAAVAADKVIGVLENTKWIGWTLSGGDGTTALNVIMAAKASF